MEIEKVVFERLNAGNPNEAFRISLFNKEDKKIKVKYFKNEEKAIKELYKIKDDNMLTIKSALIGKLYNLNNHNYITYNKELICYKKGV